MMATTHAFAGLAMAAVVATVSPDLAVPAVVGGVAGGIFPDLDVIAEHRRTLHFPVYYALVAVPAALIAVIVPGPMTVAIALFLLAAAVHAVSDAIGSGPHLRPWAVDAQRAVYVHAIGRWARPREWIRYDGAPEDFLLGAVLAVPALLAFEAPITSAVVAGLAVSLAWTAFRKPIGRRLDGSLEA